MKKPNAISLDLDNGKSGGPLHQRLVPGTQTVQPLLHSNVCKIRDKSRVEGEQNEQIENKKNARGKLDRVCSHLRYHPIEVVQEADHGERRWEAPTPTPENRKNTDARTRTNARTTKNLFTTDNRQARVIQKITCFVRGKLWLHPNDEESTSGGMQSDECGGN